MLREVVVGNIGLRSFPFLLFFLCLSISAQIFDWRTRVLQVCRFHRHIRLTHCRIQFKPFGNKTFCSWYFHIIQIWRLRDNANTIHLSPRELNRRPIRLTQCCTQFRCLGVKVLCVFHVHANTAFTFKWYGNTWNKTFYPKRFELGTTLN